MCRELNHHETEHSEKYYYEIRNLDRDKKKFNKLADYKRAARTIYLNQACFNGLYRVNSKNEFNVPFGKKTKVNTYEGQNLGIICGYLNYNDVKLLSVDFEEAVKDAKKGDFIYFDPPYESDTSTFNSYTEDGFGKEDQKRLAKVFKEFFDRGCYVMLSNHNTSLIYELYKEFNIHVIEAKRNIYSNGKKRGKVEEVILTNNLKSHPVCLTTTGEVSTSMEKVINAMPTDEKIKANEVLEINASHKIVDKLKDLYKNDKDEFTKYTKVIYYEARLIEGLPIDNPTELSNLMCDIMANK